MSFPSIHLELKLHSRILSSLRRSQSLAKGSLPGAFPLWMVHNTPRMILFIIIFRYNSRLVGSCCDRSSKASTAAVVVNITAFRIQLPGLLPATGPCMNAGSFLAYALSSAIAISRFGSKLTPNFPNLPYRQEDGSDATCQFWKPHRWYVSKLTRNSRSKPFWSLSIRL